MTSLDDDGPNVWQECEDAASLVLPSRLSVTRTLMRVHSGLSKLVAIMPKVPFEEVVQFHGHVCPGVAIGYRMALAGLAALKEMRAEDEELVAIVENDACGVDALQFLTGCTFGKGNLIFHDYGKSVYTLFSRRTGQGVRITYRADAIPAEIGDDRAAKVDWILTAPEDALLSLKAVRIDEPPKARVHDSIPCDKCGERVMATRIRKSGERGLCIPCWEREHGNRTKKDSESQ